MPQTAYSNDRLVMIAKDNFEKLSSICVQMEKEGYWQQPARILKQSSTDNLDLYVQCMLFNLADACNRLHESECRFILDVTEKNLLGMSPEGEQEEEVYTTARRMGELPPVLFQLCGVYDNQNNQDKSEYFFDSLINILLCLSSVDERRDERSDAFIRQYFEKICLFINHESGEESISRSYISRKLESGEITCEVAWLKEKGRQSQEKKLKKMQAAQAAVQPKSRDEQKVKAVSPEAGQARKKKDRPEDKERLKQMFEQRKQEYLEEIKQKERKEEEAAKEQFRLMKERIKEREKQLERERQMRLECVLEEMNQLVGLQNVKKEVQSLINLIKVAEMRKKHGMPEMEMSYHMVFAGSPGTGKTTVARLLARIYKELGILSQGQLVETDRAGLVAGYVGQTALKVTEVVEQAIGGVLFIDEAYSLTNQAAPNDFGTEAIDTLVKLMEDHRDDLVVIAAGYTDEMQTFLKGNTGLISRFNKFIDFADYTLDELVEILGCMAFSSGMLLEEGAKKEVYRQLKEMDDGEKKAFGNARGIRNMFETIVTNQANRIVTYEDPTIEQLKMITAEDVN